MEAMAGNPGVGTGFLRGLVVVEVGDAAGETVTAAMTGGGGYQGRLIQQPTVKSYVCSCNACRQLQPVRLVLYASVLVESAVTFHLLQSQAYAVLESYSRQA